MTIRHDLALSILNRELDERTAQQSELAEQNHPLSRNRYGELCSEIGQLRLTLKALTPPAEPAHPLEDYCREKGLDTAALKTAAYQVLYSYSKPGGHPAGAFTSALIRIWGLADGFNQSKIMSQWPELGTALSLMGDGNEAGLRNITEGKAP